MPASFNCIEANNTKTTQNNAGKGTCCICGEVQKLEMPSEGRLAELNRIAAGERKHEGSEQGKDVAPEKAGIRKRAETQEEKEPRGSIGQEVAQLVRTLPANER